MTANIKAQAGEGQLRLFKIFSNYGKPVDVESGVFDFHYYESILDNTTRVTASFVDTGYRKLEGFPTTEGALERGDLNLTVGERVTVTVVDGYDFVLNLDMRIKEVRNVDESVNKMVYTVDLFSKESIDNELEKNRVKKRYDGKISDNVQKILKDVLKTSKKIEVDATLNELSFIGNIEKPFYKCAWLGPRSVPTVANAKGNLAGFFFYETYDGFKFKSIDVLFSQSPKRKFIYNDVVQVEVPNGYDAKILEYTFDSNIELKKTLLTGSQVKAQMKAVNTYESAYRENSFDSKKQFNPSYIGGLEQPKIASDINLQDEETRISYKLDDQGFLVKGKNLKEQLPKSTYINYSNDEILRQSYMRFNNMFSIKLSIAIPGDMSLRAGDIVFCDFPEISGKKIRVVSQKKSGKYLIVDVCHYITKNGCFTRLNMVRESIYRK
jgi:hypothetical protein